MLNTDPVAMHLLVETALGDSQYFDILPVEEVDTLKQEQKTLDTRLVTVRRKLESETKIRDATRSLGRLASKKAMGHTRGLGSRGSNSAYQYDAQSQTGLDASNKRIDEFTRDLLQIESRMRMIDMQLLMHTAAVLQLTHKGPRKRNEKLASSGETFGRPDSPVSMVTYDIRGANGSRGDIDFDERSFYRSPENLDSLMDMLHNGTHHDSGSTQVHPQILTNTAQRLEEMNGRLRTLIIQANPERDNEYSLPPSGLDGIPDSSTIDRQLDFLDQGLRSISAEQINMTSSDEVENRIGEINRQLYTMLKQSDPRALPPPPSSGGRSIEQLSYMETSFQNVQQLQYSLSDQVAEHQLRALDNPDTEKAEKYETTLKELWQTILAGEEEARERKRDRRRMLAENPDADEQLSPDEDFNANESFSLLAFSSKVQWLFRRATSLKDKQSVLMRQVKQQRELNNKSDAQKEAEFERFKRSDSQRKV